MKNYIIGALVCLVAALVIGVEPVQRFANETANRGTLTGVETCLSYSKSELLSPEAIRFTCIQAFQKPLYSNDHATGRAGPFVEQQAIFWSGFLDNKTPDHVTTWIKVSVNIFDAAGNEEEFHGETWIWIDPLDQAEFKVALPEVEREQFDDLEFCELDTPSPKSCMSWGITEMMGLSL